MLVLKLTKRKLGHVLELKLVLVKQTQDASNVVHSTLKLDPLHFFSFIIVQGLHCENFPMLDHQLNLHYLLFPVVC
jgi:hypothetical protein